VSAAVGAVLISAAGEAPALRVPVATVALRRATPAQAGAIHQLIVEHLVEGHLLPRTREEILGHAHRFVVATRGDQVLACAELAPLSRAVSEIRSFVVSRAARRCGVGRRIVDMLAQRAAEDGFATLCAFAHTPAYFVHLGFSIVPHVWLPEKIEADCRVCAHFRRCGQYAVIRPLHA
jgi:N-acetylglutamate synthase-like GNAT family acetyltransferase